MAYRVRWAAGAVVVALVLAACGGSGDSGSDRPKDSSGKSSRAKGDVPKVIDMSALGACDPIAPRCLVPFPNDFYTVPDADTDTGRRLRFDRESMPANVAGIHIDPTEWLRNDGFSPASSLIALVPGVALEPSNLPDSAHIADSLSDDAGAVLFDLATGERRAYWAELDAQTTSSAKQLLFLRPAELFEEGHTYGVAFRGLRDPASSEIPPTSEFEVVRDRAFSADRLEPRADALDQVIDGAEEHFGWKRSEVQLAWSFTISSERSLSERVLAMRDAALETVDKETPAFQVDPVEDGDALDLPEGVMRIVTGTFEVPSFLTGKGEPGSVLNNGSAVGDSPIPEQNGTFTADFTCVIPSAAVDDDGKAAGGGAGLYGHGLLGSRDEVRGAAPEVGQATATTFCATDWEGMSEEDIPNAGAILGDLSTFRSLVDRLQQGFVNFLVLGRLLRAPDGLISDPRFQDSGGAPLIQTDKDLVFVGNSQGGILGGALSALASDWRRLVLGVPGVGYHVLLNRSIDWDQFKLIYDAAYTDPIDQQLGLLLIQSLWDRGENSGFVQHLLTDRYPATSAKQVLIFEAYADQQVANVQTEVLARTLGARAHEPLIDPERDAANGGEGYGLNPLPSAASEAPDAQIFQWDFGNPPPPLDNQAAREGEDPHGKGGDVPEVRNAVAEFLESGRLPADLCGREACATPAQPHAFQELSAPPWQQETRTPVAIDERVPSLGNPLVNPRDVLAPTPDLAVPEEIDSELLPSELDGKVRTAAYLVDGGQIGLYAAPGLGAGLDLVDGIVVIDEDGTGYAFDLWQWMVPPTATAAPEFIAEAIRWAEVRAGVLYLSNSHMTYAADTKGANAYISAIDLASGELLWRSEPLASNARNFKVVGGGIVAGYGFTAEPDRVVVLDRSTGKVVQSLPLPSGPEAFGVVGDQIIVRCYDADVLIPIAVD